jgi:hypothetical protein
MGIRKREPLGSQAEQGSRKMLQLSTGIKVWHGRAALGVNPRKVEMLETRTTKLRNICRTGRRCVQILSDSGTGYTDLDEEAIALRMPDAVRHGAF